ncbi:hypothetical protein CFC21_106348 [Triticum aestivum]|uniref:BLE2 protein n=2 Tax=Triticum aestivum TaxID=4565 RepID=A0A3B6TB11_WHEAT|nr:hypothetical protein CFC21_106348 [Triticum aestivum]
MAPPHRQVLAIFSTERKAGLNSVDDSKWAEVKHINCYATFMGYLWMAMRGVSVLVVTWTTVVLLGGFVSMLNTKDFWFLTVITLVQTAGVFDMHLSENLIAIPRLCLGFLHTVTITITREGGQVRRNERSCMPCLPAPVGRWSLMVRNVLGAVLEIAQGIAFANILCLLAAIYGFGLYITCAGCVWRLKERDYGSSDGDGANKNPALFVLYILGVFQGTILFYRIMLGRAGRRIANQVAEEYRFEDYSPVLGYLDELRIGCDKDSSFARGRNLITYALQLMESHSPDDLLSGTRILDTLITYDDSPQSPEDLPSTSVTVWTGYVNVNIHTPRQEEQKGTRMPMVKERLIGSSSSGKIFQKLLKALDSRSPCNAEMRKKAARIVCALAGDIHLKQFPGGIRCISSLLDASLHEVDEYKQLMLQGLFIIEKLATDEDNCRVMSHINGLVSMIMRPLSRDLLHRVNHDEWSDVVDASLRLTCTWLNTATGNSGEKLCSQIIVNKEAISAMLTILICDKCHKERLILAMKVLLITKIQGQENIVVQLLGIFLGYRKDDYITGLAGEKLLMLSKESKSNAKTILEGNIILEQNGDSAQRIIGALYFEERNKFRICAAGILEGLCSHYIVSQELPLHAVENELFENLKRHITDYMPGLLLKMLPAQRQRARNVSLDADVERQNTSVVSSLDNAQNGVQPEDKELQAALLSLCFTVYHKMIDKEDDLAPLLDAVRLKDPQFNLPERLIELVERNSDSTVVDCLRIVKYTAKMAKSMIRHKHFYSDQDLGRLTNSLDKACRDMSHVDAFEHLSGGDGTDTLSTLVQEARKLLHPMEQRQKPEVSIKGKEYEITEQGQSSSGSSESDILGYLCVLFREEEQQPEVSSKEKIV